MKAEEPVIPFEYNIFEYNSEKSFPKQMFETIENVSDMKNGILFNIKFTFKHLVNTQEGGWSLFRCK